MLGECSIPSHAAPVLFALVGLLALSIKGNVLSAGALIGSGEQDPRSSLSSRPHWLKRAPVEWEGPAGLKKKKNSFP